MYFYERIKKQEIEIPDKFSITYGQVLDLKKKSTNDFDLIFIAFKFGYMQGRRAERKEVAQMQNKLFKEAVRAMDVTVKMNNDEYEKCKEHYLTESAALGEGVHNFIKEFFEIADERRVLKQNG